MHVLVICDDRWHPAAIPRQGLAPLEEYDYQFDWIENAGDWSPERMAAYPLVILTKSNNVSSLDETRWVDQAVEEAFVEYVRQGSSLLVLHSGSAGYQENSLLRGLLGGVFLHHPPQCPVTVEPRPGHPMSAGSEPFTLTDEHYFMALDDAQAGIFLTTTSEHGVQPGGWTRTEGKGRVGMLTPGHNLEIWLHPSFQALLHNLMHWCARQSTP